MSNQEQTRFRSFAERFLVERASAFDKNNVDKDAWEALLQAKSAYNQIALVSESMYPDAQPSGAAGQAGVWPLAPVAPLAPATGANGYRYPPAVQQVSSKYKALAKAPPDPTVVAKLNELIKKLRKCQGMMLGKGP